MFTAMGPDWSLLEASDDANDYPVVVVHGRFLRPNGKPIGRPRLLGVAGVDGVEQLFCRLALNYPAPDGPTGRFAEISTIEVYRTRILLLDWWLEAHPVPKPVQMVCPVEVRAIPRKSTVGKPAGKSVWKPTRRK